MKNPIIKTNYYKKTYFIITSFIFVSFMMFQIQNINSEENPIIDSQMTFAEATKGTEAPKALLDSLRLLDVEYYSFDKKLHKGQILVHKLIKDEVIIFFDKAKSMRFPIHSVIPIVKFGWSDEKSMEANNSSAFNFRKVEGSDKYSNHAYGLAIDINPFNNPVIYSNGRISPQGAEYKEDGEGVFTADHPLVKGMKRQGFRWGGDWTTLKDYHHFDKIQK